MIRKPPLRTYQKKTNAQSSFCHPQTSSWKPRSLSKKISTNGQKSKPELLQDDEDINEFSSGYLDSTFDRIAKDVRLPTPPQQESGSSMNISSDAPLLLENKTSEFSWINEPAKTKASKRAKRKPNQSRPAYSVADVVVKKRLIHDLINTSTKKDKVVRSSRRKVSNKNTKNTVDGREKEKIFPQASNLNNSEARSVTQLVKDNKVPKKEKKQKNRYVLRGRRNVEKICNLSSSDDSDSDHNVNVGNVEDPKIITTKRNIVSRRKTDRKKLEDSVSLDTVLKEINNFSKLESNNENHKKKDSSVQNSPEAKDDKRSLVDCRHSANIEKINIATNDTRKNMANRNIPAFEFVSNLRKHSASISRENHDQVPVGSNKFNRILSREEYINRMQLKLMRKNNAQKEAVDPLDNLNHSDTSINNVAEKKDLATKPCSILLLKCNENQNPMTDGKESMIVPDSYNMQTSEDIFQSSISNAVSNVEMRLHESMENQEAQFIKSLTNFNDNSDLSMSKKRNVVKFSKDSVGRKHAYDSKQSLRYLKCSTPINAHVKIDETINALSPIVLNHERSKKNREPIDKKEADETSVVNSPDSRSRKYADLPKTKMRRRSARKRLSIPYGEDNSLEISDKYCEENSIVKIPAENVANRYGNDDQKQSPTSQIQESLDILKLNLENSVDEHNTDDQNEPRLSVKKITFVGDNGSNRIFESTNEFTSQSKDTCSQLTPTGIIRTRSRRQLKLSVATQKKFFDDSKDFKIHSDKEIINDLETVKTRSQQSRAKRLAKHSGDQWTAIKSHSTGEPSHYEQSINSTKNDSPKLKPDKNSSEVQTWNNSTTNEPLDSSTSRNLNTTSEGLSKDYEKYTREENRSNKYRSVVTDLRHQYTTMLSREDISQSIRESTKNLDSLIIRSQRSQVDVNSETLDNDEEMNNSEWSTLSDSGTVDSTSSNLQEKIMEVSCNNNRSTHSSGSIISDQNEPDVDSLSNALNHLSHSPPDFFPEYTEFTLTERMKLLSARINTRKRQKTFMKLVNENISQVFEDQPATQTSDKSKLTNSLDVCTRDGFNLKEEIKDKAARSFDERKQDSEMLRQLLYTNLNADLQPRVLLEKLEDPLKMQRSQKKNSDFKEPVNHEISDRSLEIIGRSSNGLFILPDMMINDTEVDEDGEDFDKLNPLYCTPDISEANNLSSNENTTSGAPKSDVKISALIKRESVSSTLHQCMITRSRKAAFIKSNSPPKARKSSPRRYKTRNLTLAWTTATALKNRQSVLSAQRQSILRRSKEANSSAEENESKANCNGENLDVSNSELIGRPSLFLKPGKEWIRSLSILNNLQNGSDLEQLSTGKGKNWRQSVQAIFIRQQEGLLQSCLGKNQDGKDTKRRSRARNRTSIPDGIPCLQGQNVRSASPSRFIKRISVRVVPDNNRLSTITDKSFLEAYGITSSKSRHSLSTTSELESGGQTLTCNVQCAEVASEFVKTEQVVTARDIILQRCDQDDYLPFTECFPTQYLDHCRKIGEGVYGEVFLYENQTEKSVIKVIPIEGEELVNGERQKKFDEILSEIVIAKELHNLRNGDKYQTHGFVEVKNIRCIEGKYPDKLIDLWKAYDNEKGSDNDCPSMFNKNQLYIVLELGHGGKDLEAYVFSSAAEAHALLVQTAVALAVAEQSLEFEHRDLHWGNLLISETKESEVTYKLDDQEYTYPTKGLQVAIIDFTLSRMSYDGCCIFNDLALDPALFTAQGEYQFEIYRLMRDTVGNNWQRFEPYTNILWLHYTIDKMMTSLRYNRKYAKGHREGLFRLHELKEVVLNYQSAFDFVTNCGKITNLQCKSTM